MRMGMRVAVLVLAVGGICVGVAAGDTAGPATSPAAAADLGFKALLEQLASDDFKVRDAGQKELEKIPYTQRGALARLADAASDPEVKARLVKREDEMELQEAIDPPPISIDVKNASLSEVAAALSEATGVKIESWPPGGGFNNGNSCTLKMERAAFWDVFAAVAKQIPVSVEGYDAFKLMNAGSALRHGVRVQGFMIFPTSVQLSTMVDPQAEPGKQVGKPSLSLSFKVVADPRVKGVRMGQPQLTEVVDDAGNVLLRTEARGDVFWPGKRMAWDAGAQLNLPEKLGSKIVSAKGVMRVTVGLGQETVEVADFEKKFKEPVTIGGRKLTFTQFEVKNGQVSFSANLEEPGMLGRMVEQGEPAEVTMRLIDSTGAQVWTETLRGGGLGGSGGMVAFTGPLKMQYSVPTRTREVTIDFEMKDLPLPPR